MAALARRGCGSAQVGEIHARPDAIGNRRRMNLLFWLTLFVVMVAIFGAALITGAWWLARYALIGIVIVGVAAQLLDTGRIVEFPLSVLAAAIAIGIADYSDRPDRQPT